MSLNGWYLLYERIHGVQIPAVSNNRKEQPEFFLCNEILGREKKSSWGVS
jgi:hypothetical protein